MFLQMGTHKLEGTGRGKCQAFSGWHRHLGFWIYISPPSQSGMEGTTWHWVGADEVPRDGEGVIQPQEGKAELGDSLLGDLGQVRQWV